MRVLTYDECAARIGIVRRTWERIISDGEGPAVVYVSKRRRGHLEDDFNEWLRNRRKPAPGEVAHSDTGRAGGAAATRRPAIDSSK
jgi:predicted DNA-binding transcriptional regulator AlpA